MPQSWRFLPSAPQPEPSFPVYSATKGKFTRLHSVATPWLQNRPQSIRVMNRTKPSNNHSSEILVRRLSHFALLSGSEIELLRSIPALPETLAPGTELLAEGEMVDNSRVLLSGWACRNRILPDGRRQIFEFIVPGDLYGLCHRPQAIALSNAVTLTEAAIGDASVLSDAILRRAQRYPSLVEACYISASFDEAYLLNQLVRSGRQSAYERVAHLVLELYHRLGLVGLTHARTFSLPLTQEMLADALGLSIVHLNRTLQQLRREGLISFKGGLMQLLKPDALAEIGDFRVPQVSAHKADQIHAA
jgi:CRP-like cAMP-binding protein